MKPISSIAFSLCLACVAPSVVAAENAGDDYLFNLYGDEDLVSITNGYKTPVQVAPSVATVIHHDQIRAMGATDLDQVLEMVPGLHVSYHAVAYNSTFLMRGISSDFNPQVLMLINGIPINQLHQGDRGSGWGGMPVEAIERIEVIRGPGSALYGADAFAGVINVITKDYDTLYENEVGIRVGKYHTQDAWTRVKAEVAGLKLATFIEYHKTDGYDGTIGSDAQTLNDQAMGTDVSLASGSVDLSRQNLDARFDVKYEHWQLRAGLQQRRRVGMGAGLALALSNDDGSDFERDRWSLDLTYDNDNLTDILGLKVVASVINSHLEPDGNSILYPPGFADIYTEGLIGNPEVSERHSRLGVTMDIHAWQQNRIVVGTGFNYLDMYKVRESKNFGLNPFTGAAISPDTIVDVSDTGAEFIFEGARKNVYAFIQDTWHFSPDWELTAGLRYDDYSDFGSTTNPRLALVWNADYNLTVKWLAGQAFRAPSFAETRAQANPVALGNPDLDPEVISTYEFAMHYEPSVDVAWSFNIYRYLWQDKIEYKPFNDGTTAGNVADNIGAQDGKGFEIELDWNLAPKVNLLTNYAYQKSTDIRTGEEVANMPKNQFFANLNWNVLGEWSLSSQFNWVGNRKRVAADARDDIDDIYTLDFKVAKKNLLPDLEAGFSVKNVFNDEVREPAAFGYNGLPVVAVPDDYPVAGRTIWADLRYKF